MGILLASNRSDQVHRLVSDTRKDLIAVCEPEANETDKAFLVSFKAIVKPKSAKPPGRKTS